MCVDDDALRKRVSVQKRQTLAQQLQRIAGRDLRAGSRVGSPRVRCSTIVVVEVNVMFAFWFAGGEQIAVGRRAGNAERQTGCVAARWSLRHVCQGCDTVAGASQGCWMVLLS